MVLVAFGPASGDLEISLPLSGDVVYSAAVLFVTLFWSRITDRCSWKILPSCSDVAHELTFAGMDNMPRPGDPVSGLFWLYGARQKPARRHLFGISPLGPRPSTALAARRSHHFGPQTFITLGEIWTHWARYAPAAVACQSAAHTRRTVGGSTGGDNTASVPYCDTTDCLRQEVRRCGG